MGERPIPLCDSRHAHAPNWHTRGYRRKDGTFAPPCGSPGKAPLERDYGRFATVSPTPSELSRMFGSHLGNIGGVVPNGRIVIDVDPRSEGLESFEAYTHGYGALPLTTTVLTGGDGFHYYFELPEGVTIPAGGSLASAELPGVEWKGSGAQVVLPPSIHSSGGAYRWKPGCGLGEVAIAPIPEPLLDLILESTGTKRKPTPEPSPKRGARKEPRSEVQAPDVQRHFAGLWGSKGLHIGDRAGDRLYICPLHNDTSPSIHIDSQRCIWCCFSPQCVAYGGGGVRELEALVGIDTLAGAPRPVSHRIESGSDTLTTLLRKESGPGGNGLSSDGSDDLDDRAHSLFPLPKGVQPRILTGIYASTRTPGVALRQQIISNTWNNPANRVIKGRVYYAHLMKKIVNVPNDDSSGLFEVVVPKEDWTDLRRKAMGSQVRRRKGEYACFDNRTTAGVVRFITIVPIPGSTPVKDAEEALVSALRDLDMPEEGERKTRVHLVWLSKGWALPAHEPTGTMRLIAFRQSVERVDDDQEAAEAKRLDITSWRGRVRSLQEWSHPRFFVVQQERIKANGKRATLEELLSLATALGYTAVSDPMGRVFGKEIPEGDEQAFPPANGPNELALKGER